MTEDVVKRGNESSRLARKKDRYGTYSRLGMDYFIGHHFGINPNSQAVTYIVNTYLESINEDLFMWVRTPKNGSPMVLTKSTLEKHYSDLLEVCDSLDDVRDLFHYLYNLEFRVDEKEECLYTDLYRYESRTKLNFTGIVMEYQRLTTLLEKKHYKL